MIAKGLRKNILAIKIKLILILEIITSLPLKVIKKYLKSNFKDLYETSFALLFTTFGNLFTGYFMGVYSSNLAIIPALLILIPGAIAMRGNIFGAFGSRLGSYLHLGQIEPYFKKSKLLNQNILSSFSLSFLMSFFLAITSSILAKVLNISYNTIDLSLISLFAGVISGFIMIIPTVLTAFLSYRKGWNPDNLGAPLITLFGDITTLPFLFISANFILRLSHTFRNLLFIFFLLLTVIFLLLSFFSKPYSNRILVESIPVFIFCGVLGTLSGGILSARIENLILVAGIFTLIPAFLEDGGALGGILSANFSSWLHLGTLESTFFPSKKVIAKFLNTHIVGVLPFSLIGILAYGLNSLLALPTPSVKSLFLVSLLAGEFLILMVNLLTFLLSIITYKTRLNPDNVVIPLVTSFMDILGSVSLIFFLILFNII